MNFIHICQRKSNAGNEYEDGNRGPAKGIYTDIDLKVGMGEKNDSLRNMNHHNTKNRNSSQEIQLNYVFSVHYVKIFNVGLLNSIKYPNRRSRRR